MNFAKVIFSYKQVAYCIAGIFVLFAMIFTYGEYKYREGVTSERTTQEEKRRVAQQAWDTVQKVLEERHKKDMGELRAQMEKDSNTLKQLILDTKYDRECVPEDGLEFLDRKIDKYEN